MQVLHKLQKHSIPGNLLKWGLLGFCRTLRFANGFTPLQPKPLDSIINIERAKDQPTEDLATIWHDVISHFYFLFFFVFLYQVERVKPSFSCEL